MSGAQLDQIAPRDSPRQGRQFARTQEDVEDPVHQRGQELGLHPAEHRVLAEIYGDQIEAGVAEPSRGAQYHASKFMEAMIELVDYVGIDGEAQYYGDGDYWDAGVCD